MLLAFFYGQSRIFFVMSRDGLLPRSWSVTSARRKTPVRLQLAVGAQGDLQATVQGVGTVARETNTNLDATAELFGRLAASGKELNITKRVEQLQGEAA